MFKLLGMTKVDLTMGLYTMRKTRRTRGKTQPPVSLHQVSIGLRFQWTSSSPLLKKIKQNKKTHPKTFSLKNAETSHSNYCTTWQHTASPGCGQNHSWQRFTIFHKNTKNKRSYLSVRKSGPGADKHSRREVFGPVPRRCAPIEVVGTSWRE